MVVLVERTTAMTLMMGEVEALGRGSEPIVMRMMRTENRWEGLGCWWMSPSYCIMVIIDDALCGHVWRSFTALEERRGGRGRVSESFFWGSELLYGLRWP